MLQLNSLVGVKRFISITEDWDVYMSGALSAISKEEYDYVTSQIYDRVHKICDEISLKCYLPHRSQTTPTKVMPHSKVWEIDYERVVHSKAIVAYIGIPACGVGAEIEMARRENVPIILLFESTKRGSLPQLLLGNPQIKSAIAFDKPDEIDVKLRSTLKQVLSEAHSSRSDAETASPENRNLGTMELDEKNVYVAGTLNTLFDQNKKISVITEEVQQVCERINVRCVPDKSQIRLDDSTPRQIWQELQKGYRYFWGGRGRCELARL